MTGIKAERPILVTGSLIPKILDGSKTQTRRLRGLTGINEIQGKYDFLGWSDKLDKLGRQLARFKAVGAGVERLVACPYGKVGDTLWVCETFFKTAEGFIYRADNMGFPDRWSAGIHMPRAASRIDLEIKDLRVEKVKKISETDARAEGVDPIGVEDDKFREGFRQIWITLNGEHLWSSNPWAWVIEFSAIKKP